jgi:hypothetical protein
LRERPDGSGFPIEKTTTNSDIPCVLRFLLNLCHRPAYRFGLGRDPRGRFRNPRFASFMTATNRKAMDTDIHDAVLRGRKLMRHAFRFALLGGGAWVVLESAKALSVF